MKRIKWVHCLCPTQYIIIYFFYDRINFVQLIKREFYETNLRVSNDIFGSGAQNQLIWIS